MPQDEVVNKQVIQIGAIALHDENFFISLVTDTRAALQDLQRRGVLQVEPAAVEYMVGLIEAERAAGTRMEPEELRHIWKGPGIALGWGNGDQWCHVWMPPQFHPGAPPAR